MDSSLFDGHLQMALGERDQEVRAFAAKASAESFTYEICHGRPDRSSQDSHTQVRHSLVQFPREDAVPIMDQESIRMVTWKCLLELLQCPFRSRVGGDVVMENSSRSEFHDHEYAQGAESGCDDDEKVTRHDHLGMVVDEGQPTLLWIGRAHRSAATQALLYGAGRDPDPEFQFAFVSDPFLAPRWILSGHFSDQLPQWFG